MKLFKFFALVYLIINTEATAAQVKLHDLPPSIRSNNQISTALVNKKEYIAVFKKNLNKNTVEFYNPENLTQAVKKSDIDHSNVFLTSGIKTNLIVGASSAGIWRASTVSNEFKVGLARSLSNFQLITSAIKVGDFYYFGGRNQAGLPHIEKYDAKLTKGTTIDLNLSEQGEAIMLGADKVGITVAVNMDAGGSSIAKVKLDRSVEIIKLAGSASHAILIDSGYLAVYSRDRDVFVARMNRMGGVAWSTRLLTRLGVNSLRYRIYQDGKNFSITGYNDGKLILKTVDLDGKIESHDFTFSSIGHPSNDGIFDAIEESGRLFVLGLSVSKNGNNATEELFLISKPLSNR
jgi:hypothetical protein